MMFTEVNLEPTSSLSDSGIEVGKKVLLPALTNPKLFTLLSLELTLPFSSSTQDSSQGFMMVGETATSKMDSFVHRIKVHLLQI